MTLDRRAFLASAAAAGALAGCLGGADTGDGTDAGTSGGETTAATSGASASRTEGTNPTATAGMASVPDHPATGALAGQPFLGPEPGAAPTLLVAFEDPSCHNCRRFNQNTLPKLESNLIEPGETTYVYRNFPHAFPWGEPAMQALEATYARGEAPSGR